SSGRRWNFFVSNGADAKFVFGENRRVQRNLVPISKSPSRFETHGLRATTAIKSFPLRFRRYVETPGQTHFDLLSEKMIRWSVPKSLSFIQFAEEECPRGQHVGIYCVGKTATRIRRRRAVGAGDFFVRAGPSLGCDHDRLLSRHLPTG